MSAPSVPAVVPAPTIEPLEIRNLATGEQVTLTTALTPQEACHMHVNVAALISALRAYQGWCEATIADHMAASHAARMFADGVVYKYEPGAVAIVDHPNLIAGLEALTKTDPPVFSVQDLEAAIIRPEPKPADPPKVHLGRLKSLLKYGDAVAAVVNKYKRDEPTPPKLVIEKVVS